MKQNYPNPVSIRLPDDLRPPLISWMAANGYKTLSAAVIGMIRLTLGAPKPEKPAKVAAEVAPMTALDGLIPEKQDDFPADLLSSVFADPEGQETDA